MDISTISEQVIYLLAALGLLDYIQWFVMALVAIAGVRHLLSGRD